MPELLTSWNLRCPQLIDELQVGVRKDGLGGIELVAEVADCFIVCGLGEMMQAHRQSSVLEVWNQIDFGLVDLSQQSTGIVGSAELVSE